jgi:hypothetical protein
MMELTGAALAVLMVGATHYVDVGRGKDAVIYYPTETAAHMVLPDGKTFKGTWQATQRGYFVSWNDGPRGEWKITYAPGRFVYIAPDGKDAGHITRIVPGNPEKF